MRRLNISVTVLTILTLLLYYLGPLRPFVDNHQMVSGIIFGIILGLIPSAWMGHIGNRITEEKNKEGLHAKQKRFINELSRAAESFITSPPKDEEEVGKRRNTVTATVKRLSNELFDEDSPPLETVRPENTVYEPMHCKWCHRPHEAWGGTRGDCKTCHLPLDFWIGSQGQPR
jgi:hypothetical protein